MNKTAQRNNIQSFPVSLIEFWNRFGIFVERCAPIQINYLGYPGTLGSKSIDYIIADKITIPKQYQNFYKFEE